MSNSRKEAASRLWILFTCSHNSMPPFFGTTDSCWWTCRLPGFLSVLLYTGDVHWTEIHRVCQDVGTFQSAKAVESLDLCSILCNWGFDIEAHLYFVILEMRFTFATKT